MSNVNAVNPEHRVTIAARVPPALAAEIAALADAGDRSVSREIYRAVRAHVKSGGLSRPVPVERRETSEVAGQLSSTALAGPKK